MDDGLIVRRVDVQLPERRRRFDSQTRAFDGR